MTHRCGWDEVRQPKDRWPPPVHVSEILDRLLDAMESPETFFREVVTVGIGFLGGFLLGAAGTARRWSRRQAEYGMISLVGRLSKWLGSRPDLTDLLAISVGAGLALAGVNAWPGEAVPAATLVLRRTGPLAERRLTRLRPVVRAEWIGDLGWRFGRMFAGWSLQPD